MDNEDFINLIQNGVKNTLMDKDLKKGIRPSYFAFKQKDGSSLLFEFTITHFDKDIEPLTQLIISPRV